MKAALSFTCLISATVAQANEGFVLEPYNWENVVSDDPETGQRRLLTNRFDWREVETEIFVPHMVIDGLGIFGAVYVRNQKEIDAAYASLDAWLADNKEPGFWCQEWQTADGVPFQACRDVKETEIKTTQLSVIRADNVNGLS